MSLTRNQRRGFLAAWGGWALDGMDSFIYALVMVPALRELLPRSGQAASTANIGYYGSILFALFLIGWGFSFIWGPLADRFGRVRTLMLTILVYSLFTFAGALATSVWQLAIFRLLAGIGIGGEWTLGGTFVAEEWPEDRRQMGAGLMQTGYYFGTLIAALLNATVGAHYGWRAMFAVGGFPTLLVLLIRYGVTEPSRWKPSTSTVKPFMMIFSREYRRRTILNSLYLLVSITGLWAGSVYVPTAVTALAIKDGVSAPQAASLGTAILSIGTILGCIAVPIVAIRIGRRATLGVFFAIMFFTVSIGFGYLLYLPSGALPWFQLNLFFWASAAPISPSTRCGFRSNIAPNAAPARSPSPPHRDGSSALGSRSWSARASPISEASGRQSRSPPSLFWLAFSCYPSEWRLKDSLYLNESLRPL